MDLQNFCFVCMGTLGKMEITPTSTEARILCCQCGIPIAPNSANTCINCLRSTVDITDEISKQIMINFCRNCERYLQPPAQWILCALESRELLSLCLRRIKGLSKVRLIDAGFIWTEPHSKRLKVKLTIQKEILASTVLQQTFVVEATVVYTQCPDCTRLMAKDTWKAVVQLRQKVSHKRTFFYLEQLILKHALHKEIIRVKQTKDGLDFFYSTKNHALRMLEFLQAVVPMKYKSSEQLISEDIHSGAANYKFTFSAEIIPICRDDLVVLPPTVANSLSGISQIVLCSKVGSLVHFIDPTTLKTAEMHATTYWRTPFEALCSSDQLSEFYVLDVEYGGVTNGKCGLADIVVAKSSDFGYNNRTFSIKTHLGFILKVGDSVLGYDLNTGNFNNPNLESLSKRCVLPDVVLVRKSYRTSRKNKKHRKWKLKSLSKEEEDIPIKKGVQEKAAMDYEMFLEDIEEDPEFRSGMNIYRNEAYKVSLSAEMNATDDEEEDFPEIDITEMLDELDLEDE